MDNFVVALKKKDFKKTNKTVENEHKIYFYFCTDDDYWNRNSLLLKCNKCTVFGCAF